MNGPYSSMGRHVPCTCLSGPVARYLLGVLFASLSGILSCAVAQKAPTSSRPAEVREGFLSVSDGTRLYYRRVGRAGPIVVIPGDLFTYDGFAPLGVDRALVFYDMRNRGRSDAVRDTTTLTVQQDVRDLEDVRRHFGAERVSLVGYSYLGLMVMLYALDHPKRIDRVVQLGPVPRRFGTRYPDGMGAAPPPALSDSSPVTILPARINGTSDSLGSIEAGKLADIVLLDANPLTDIRNTRKIRAVIANGRLLERDSLDQLLAEAEANFDRTSTRAIEAFRQ